MPARPPSPFGKGTPPVRPEVQGSVQAEGRDCRQLFWSEPGHAHIASARASAAASYPPQTSNVLKHSRQVSNPTTLNFSGLHERASGHLATCCWHGGGSKQRMFEPWGA
ncbi:unnamed protein product [Prorocentrum cordatum]|uniref:Uncharacterized protein n=1 Tax=Prorocentrum cordatum TaxID=2364126 RepID=A0ABN9WDT1_9DINO|nr:unnamed protein product [Polarella glacialis]